MNHGRQVGVRIPQNQSSEQAPTMTVTNVMPAQFALVEYGDERGLKHTTLALIFGNRAYVPPNGDAWTEGFRPFATVINDQIMVKVNMQPARNDVPQQDFVDVLGNGSAPTQAQLDAAEDKLRNG